MAANPATHDTRLRVELNQPYLGIDDGLTTAMRQQFADHDYAGIELEINHRIMRRRNRADKPFVADAWVMLWTKHSRKWLTYVIVQILLQRLGIVSPA